MAGPAYQRKEELREIFGTDLDPGDAEVLLTAHCKGAASSQMGTFIKIGHTIREHIPYIVAAIERSLSSGRVQGAHPKVRLIIRRAFGFHSAKAALALVKLSCGTGHTPASPARHRTSASALIRGNSKGLEPAQ